MLNHHYDYSYSQWLDCGLNRSPLGGLDDDLIEHADYSCAQLDARGFRATGKLLRV